MQVSAKPVPPFQQMSDGSEVHCLSEVMVGVCKANKLYRSLHGFKIKSSGWNLPFQQTFPELKNGVPDDKMVVLVYPNPGFKLVAVEHHGHLNKLQIKMVETADPDFVSIACLVVERDQAKLKVQVDQTKVSPLFKPGAVATRNDATQHSAIFGRPYNKFAPA